MSQNENSKAAVLSKRLAVMAMLAVCAFAPLTAEAQTTKKLFSEPVLQLWRDRINKGEFKTVTTVNGNFRGGEVSHMNQRADRFVKNPLVTGSNNSISNQLWGGYPGSVIDPSSGAAAYPVYQGVDMIAAATRYQLFGNVADAQAVRSAILAQISLRKSGFIGNQPDQWPDVLPSGGARPNYESGVPEANWIKRLAYSFDMTSDVFSAAEQTQVKNWLLLWGQKISKPINDRLVQYNPDRLSGIYTNLKGIANPVGESFYARRPEMGLDPFYVKLSTTTNAGPSSRYRVYLPQNLLPAFTNADGKNGPLISQIGLQYNNRVAAKMAAVAAIAKVTGDNGLKSHVNAFGRDFMVFSVFPTGDITENERNGDYCTKDEQGACMNNGFVNRGFGHYGINDTIERIAEMAYLQSLSGDNTLRDYSSPFGVNSGTDGVTPKSLRLVLNRMIDIISGKVSIYYGKVSAATRITNVNQNPVLGWSDNFVTGFIQSCGLGAMLYNNQRFADCASNTIPGMAPIPSTGHSSAGMVAGGFIGGSAQFAGTQLQFGNLPLSELQPLSISGGGLYANGTRSINLTASVNRATYSWRVVSPHPVVLTNTTSRTVTLSGVNGGPLPATTHRLQVTTVQGKLTEVKTVDITIVSSITGTTALRTTSGN